MPLRESDLVVWYINFKNKMQQLYAASLGFTTSEINSIVADAAMLQYVFQLKDGCKNAAQSFSEILKALRSTTQQTPMGTLPSVPVAGTPPAAVLNGIIARLNGYVQRIRHHANYTLSIGQDLDIIPPSNTFNPATAKPVLKGRVDSGYPRLTWRNGKTDGVQLYVDRGDGNGYVLLAKRNSTSYIDIAPMPANTNFVTWSYKARYILDDEEIGLESDILTLEVIRV